MNHRVTAPRPARNHRTLRWLTAFILPAIGPGVVYGAPRVGRADKPSVADLRRMQLPYLPVCGAPPLRFDRPAPPPDVATNPPAAAPPIPSLTPTENLVASANTAAMQPAEPATLASPVPAVAAPASSGPREILPDDTRPAIRAEDFLPFFRVPSGGRGGTETSVLVPGVPAPPPGPAIPASSANYTQTPR